MDVTGARMVGFEWHFEPLGEEAKWEQTQNNTVVPQMGTEKNLDIINIQKIELNERIQRRVICTQI